MISMQSNEICEKDKKKTIAPEHAIQAISVSICAVMNWAFDLSQMLDTDFGLGTA
jgi:hypothetical protein